MRFPFDNSSFSKWAWEHGYDPEWINKESTKLGERYHAYVENRHYGISEWADEIETDKDRKYHEAVDNFFKDGWEVLESELQVYNNDWNYAGRFDAILSNKKLGYERIIGDFKTYGAWKGSAYKKDKKKLEKLSMQLTLYNEAMNGKQKMGQVGIIFDGTGKYNLEYIPIDLSVFDWLQENRNEIVKILSKQNVSRK